jgi:hypothetical protein
MGDGDPALAPTMASDPALARTGTPSPSDRAVALKVGQRLGDRYVVRAFLGEGGMGAVYRALDEKLDEEVALKVVRGAIASDARLRDEVRLAQKVTHPNVCRTYDLEDIDGFHLVKMEFVAGETLAHVLAGGKLPVDRAIAIARALLAGLGAAHARDIIHRDLKPGNVMLAGDRVVLMDFGLAQHASAESDVAGTPGYMAPEQLDGSELDGRADLYALGCVLYEMLAGKRLFTAATAADRAVPDVRAACPSAPRWLARAVALLLANDPSRRPAGARLLARGPRSRALVLAIVAPVLLAAAAAGVYLKLRPTPWVPLVEDLPTAVENSDTVWFSPDGKSIAYPSDREERDANRAYVAGVHDDEPRAVSPRGVRVLVDGWTRDGAALLLHTQEARHVLRQPVNGSPWTDLGPGRVIVACGDAFAVLSPTFDRSVVRLTDDRGEVFVGAGESEVVSSIACDPEGRRLLVAYGSVRSGDHADLALVDLVDPQHRRQVLTSDHANLGGTFAPDGRSIVYAASHDGKSVIREMMLADHAVHDLTEGPNDIAPVVSPDGKTLLFEHDVTARLVVIGDRRGFRKLTTRVEVMEQVVPTRDGSTLVGQRDGAASPEIVVIDVATGRERKIADGGAAFPSYDGSAVYMHSAANPRELVAVPLAGGNARHVADLPGDIIDGRDAEDGIHLELQHAGAYEAMVVRRDGTQVVEGAAGLVVPAPDLAWRVVVMSSREDQWRLRVVPPGASLSTGREIEADGFLVTWLGPHELSYAAGGKLHIYDVTSDREVDHVDGAPHGSPMMVLSPDREHWFDLAFDAHTTRHLITNFAERPWR